MQPYFQYYASGYYRYYDNGICTTPHVIPVGGVMAGNNTLHNVYVSWRCRDLFAESVFGIFGADFERERGGWC